MATAGGSLRARDAASLGAIYAQVVALYRGRTVFVAGDDRTGRGELLHGWAAELERARPRPIVLGGAFESWKLRALGAGRIVGVQRAGEA